MRGAPSTGSVAVGERAVAPGRARRWVISVHRGADARPTEVRSVAALTVGVECPECEGIGCAGFNEDDDGRFWPAGTCAACGGEGVIPSPVAALSPACERRDGRGFHTKASGIFAGTTFRVNCLACWGAGVGSAFRSA